MDALEHFATWVAVGVTLLFLILILLVCVAAVWALSTGALTRLGMSTSAPVAPPPAHRRHRASVAAAAAAAASCDQEQFTAEARPPAPMWW